MKKLFSLVLVSALCMSISSSAFAMDQTDKSDQILEESKFEVTVFEGELFYTYQDEDIVYCSQISSDGTMQFSYITKTDKAIYSSDTFSVANFLSAIENPSETNNKKQESPIAINIAIIKNLDFFTTLEKFDSSEFKNVEQGTMAVPSINSQLTATFGANYSGTILKASAKLYNGKYYTTTCYGYQSTYELKNAAYSFAAGHAVTAIIAWITLGVFACSITWFLSAAAAVTETINTIKYIKYAISGSLFAYECARTRIVNVYGYSNTMYWAGWTLKNEFLYNGSTWDTNNYHDVKHWDYEDVSGLIDTGFQNFVNYYL